MITSQALLANAARQNHLCLRFFYDIYDSPHPATFCRILDKPKEAAGPAEPPTPPLSSGHETTPRSEPSIHISLHSELQPGSTGIVHVGTMAAGQSGPTAKVAVKLAFSRDEKSRLMEEHQIYSRLHSRGVQGIPLDIGLFVDEELLLGAEGPYALVMSYAGVSLFGRLKHASNPVKQVVNPVYIPIDSHSICRDSLLATLRSIHRADILHGDIRLSNLCATASGEAFVVDFSHASKNRSRKWKTREIKDLAYVLEMDLPMEPAAKDVEKKPVVLRRSARIKRLKRKSKVEPKNGQVKRGKSTRRKRK
jgi:serine/threonine protein kinase